MPIGRHLCSGCLMRGCTIEAFATASRINAAALDATIFSEHGKAGQGLSYGKGTKSFNRFQGDASNTPNPCVDPPDTAPFYTIRLVMGDSGRYIGRAVDGHGRVLDREGKRVQGLFAVGNDAVS
jgi:FAD binding domain